MVNGPAAGYVFLCSDATESECLAKRLFGSTIPNFQPYIDQDTLLFLYNTSSRLLRGVWKARYQSQLSTAWTVNYAALRTWGYQEASVQFTIVNEDLQLLYRGLGVNGIDPGAFRGAFQAQQPVERTAECTPVSVQKFNSIVKFYQYGRFHQNLDAQQVAKLSATLHLRPLRPALSQPSPDKGNSSAAAQKIAAVVPTPAAIDEPSASCRVSHGTAADKPTDGGAAADIRTGKAANDKRKAAPAAAAPAASRGVPQLSTDSKSAAAHARSNGAQQPLAFQLNGLKSMKAGPANASKPGRKLSLASVLDDIFEEIRSTPRSSRRRKRRRDDKAQKAEAAHAALAVLPMSPIAASVPDNEHKSVPPHEQQAATASEAPVPHEGIGLLPAAPVGDSSAQPEVEKGSVAPPVPTSSRHQPTQLHAGLAPRDRSLQQQSCPAARAPALTKPAPVDPQPMERAPEQSEATPPTQAAAVTQSKVTDTGQQLKVLPLVPGSALICACSAQVADRAFNKHQLPLPQRLREEQPHAVIRQGMRVFLHNPDTRRLLGPFYAQQTKASELEVACDRSHTVHSSSRDFIRSRVLTAWRSLDRACRKSVSLTCGDKTKVNGIMSLFEEGWPMSVVWGARMDSWDPPFSICAGVCVREGASAGAQRGRHPGQADASCAASGGPGPCDRAWRVPADLPLLC